MPTTNAASSFAERRSWDKALAACAQSIDRRIRAGYRTGRLSQLVRGNVYFELGDYARALADYDELIDFLSDDDTWFAGFAYYRRGLVHEKMGAREKAVADLRRARAMHTTVAERGAELAAVAEALRRLGVPD